MLEKYPDKIKIAFKHFPLKNHSFARQAAIASVSAGEQGKFWEFHDSLFENVSQLNNDKVREIAENLGLDMERFAKSLKDPEIAAFIESDVRDAAAAGVRGTPTVFINGRMLRNRNLQGFQAIIEKILHSESGK